METWLTAPVSDLIKVAVSSMLIFTVMLALTRMAGLRTFAKMSSIDFATTIAVGSILASVVLSSNTSVVKGFVALASIVGLKMAFSWLNKRFDNFERYSTNHPILLMDGSTILEENLRRTHVSRSDLIAKLREANVCHFSEVYAVVMETTGDVSVLHGDREVDPDALQAELLEKVQR